MGPPGVGKTSSAEALALEMGWGIIEMNASDQRKGTEIENIAGRGSRSNTFTDDGSYLNTSSGGRKLIVLDEADNFLGNQDRGAVPAVNQLISETRQPVILIVNDFYGLSSKSNAVKTRTLQIQYKRPSASSIAKALQKIADAEGVKVDSVAMQTIAEKACGDMRAAVRNLESVSIGSQTVTREMSDDISTRESRTDKFSMVNAVFHLSPQQARKAVIETDEDIDAKLLWIEENIPSAYLDAGDLVRGYEKLSKAAIFLGRASRRQYFGFWSYASDYTSFALASSRMSNNIGRDRLRAPSYLMRMKRSSGSRNSRKSLSSKMSAVLHCTPSSAEASIVPYLSKIVNADEEIRPYLLLSMYLTDSELGYLMGQKADSKVVKKAFEDAEAMLAGSVPKAISEPVQEIVAPEPPAEPKPQKQSQKNLFDF